MLVWCMLFSLAAVSAVCTANIHPNKTVNKKKAENVRNKVYQKIAYSCIISKQNVTILPTKIQVQWMTMNELSIIDGLVRPEEINVCCSTISIL